MNLQEAYKQIISDFIEATKSENIVWKKQNPTTYFVEALSKDSQAIVSIQKVITKITSVKTSMGQIVKRNPITNYLFTVKNPTTKENIINLDTNQEGEYLQALNELFNLIEYNFEMRNIEFLKGIIENIKKHEQE